MKAETIILLVKENEKINSKSSRNSYYGAWLQLVIAVSMLIGLFLSSIEPAVFKGVEWSLAIMFVIALALLLQSFYVIIRYITNKKFAIIIEALLENKTE